MADTNDIIVEEYKQITSQIADLERHVYQLLQNGVLASSSILAAVIVFAFNGDLEKATQLRATLISFSLLLPAVVMLAVFYILYGLRLEAFFLGKYVQVFFDERDAGTFFESNLEKLRLHRKSENMDYIVAIVWTMLLICGGVFIYVVLSSASPNCIIIAIAPLVIATGVLQVSYTRGIRKASRKFVDDWRNLSKLQLSTVKDSGSPPDV